MATAYPGGIDSFANNTDGVDIVLAADMNNVQDAITALENALAANPNTISDTSTPPVASPASVAAYLKMVAYQLKAIIDATSWRTTPAITLAQVANRAFITNGADGTLSAETAIATVINAGALGSRPAAAAGNAGWLWLTTTGGTTATPNNSVSRSDGSAWTNIGFFFNGTPAKGDILYYDTANQRFERLAIGTSGQGLAVSGGLPAWANPAVSSTLPSGTWTAWNGSTLTLDVKLRLPVIVATDGTLTEASTIQNAINVASSGQWVVVPPGTYTENLSIKNGVNVCELIPGTVTLIGTITPAASACTAIVSLDTIAPASAVLSNGCAISLSHTTGRLVIRARVINNTVPAAAGVTDVSAVIVTGAGTMDLIADQVTVDGSGSSFATCNAYAVYQQTGSCALNLYFKSVTVTAGASGTSYGVSSAGANSPVTTAMGGNWSGVGTYAFYRTLGTLNIYDCQYDITKTSGTLTFLSGDRMRPAQQRLFAQVFSN